MDYSEEKEDKILKIDISKTIYEKDAVLSAAYSFSDKFGIRIESESGDFFNLIIEPLEHQKETNIKEVEHKFNNELIDQQLRLDLEKRFGSLRELIVKHAFSPLENLKAETNKIVGRE